MYKYFTLLVLLVILQNISTFAIENNKIESNIIVYKKSTISYISYNNGLSWSVLTESIANGTKLSNKIIYIRNNIKYISNDNGSTWMADEVMTNVFSLSENVETKYFEYQYNNNLVSIFDIYGNFLKNFENNTNTMLSQNLNGLLPGTYFIVSIDNTKILTKKVILE
jgi:hypothetical protein